MHVVLLLLDAVDPLDARILEDLVGYFGSFFCLEVRIVRVQETPISQQGWQALHERVHEPLNTREGRPGSGVERQLYTVHLLQCLKLLLPGATNIQHGVEEVGDAECILGLTACELYTNTVGLTQDEPVPASRVEEFVALSTKQRVGVCTLTQLACQARDGPARRKLVRQLLGLLTRTLLELLGLRKCQYQQCLAYLRQPVSPEPLLKGLCPHCEEVVLIRNLPGSKLDALIRAAAERYRGLAEVLSSMGSCQSPIQLSRRQYTLFEEECDWLCVAEEILLESAGERKGALTTGAKSRRRSLLHCLQRAHEAQPPCTSKRTFAEPLLRKTCLVDMAMSAPFRHDSGDLSKWSNAIINRRHSSGGHYVELGGSLKQKTIGTFIDSGLNASMVRRKSTQDLRPPGLPPIRSRSSSCCF